MADKGEARSAFDVVDVLGVDEVVDFHNEVIWPAVERLSGTNFRDDAQPGEEFVFSRTRLTPSGFLRVLVRADCWQEFTHDEEAGAALDVPPSRASKVIIGVDKSQADLTEPLRALAFEGRQGSSSDEPGVDETLMAWQVAYSEFYDGLEPDELFYSRSDYELQDEEGETIWSPSMALADARSADSTEDLLGLHELENEICSGLESSQCREIIEALAALGITSTWSLPEIAAD